MSRSLGQTLGQEPASSAPLPVPSAHWGQLQAWLGRLGHVSSVGRASCSCSAGVAAWPLPSPPLGHVSTCRGPGPGPRGKPHHPPSWDRRTSPSLACSPVPAPSVRKCRAEEEGVAGGRGVSASSQQVPARLAQRSPAPPSPALAPPRWPPAAAPTLPTALLPLLSTAAHSHCLVLMSTCRAGQFVHVARECL